MKTQSMTPVYSLYRSKPEEGKYQFDYYGEKKKWHCTIHFWQCGKEIISTLFTSSSMMQRKDGGVPFSLIIVHDKRDTRDTPKESYIVNSRQKEFEEYVKTLTPLGGRRRMSSIEDFKQLHARVHNDMLYGAPYLDKKEFPICVKELPALLPGAYNYL